MKNTMRVNKKRNAMMKRRRITVVFSCTIVLVLAILLVMNFSNGSTKKVLASDTSSVVKNELHLNSSISITNPDNYIAYSNNAKDDVSYIQSRMIDVFKNSIEYCNTGDKDALNRAQQSVHQLGRISESNMTQTCRSIYDYAYRYNNLSDDEQGYTEVAVDQFLQDYECVFGYDIMDSIQFK